MKYGLSDAQLQEIIKVLKQSPEIEKAVLFGSRAIDTFKEASDVDIALFGEKVDFMTAAHIKDELEEETYLPFFFDVIAYNSIDNDALKEHIRKFGSVVYGGDESWRSLTLGEVAEVFDSLHKTPQYVENGVPMVRVTDVKKGRLDLKGTLKVDENVFAEFSKKHLPRIGDIVFTRVGSYGNSCIVKNNEKFCLGQNTVLISPKEDPDYLYYFLNSPDAENQIASSVAGSTQPTISLKSIKNLKINMPPLSEQKAIAEVLSSLDDKIDLLHRQNKTLEALAETLFRQWFVEGVQEDWENGVLGDFVAIKGGTTPSTKKSEFWGGDIYWTTPRDLSAHNAVYLFDTERKITEKGLLEIGSGLMPVGTVLLSSRAPIGYLAIADIPVAINQGYIAIVCDQGISNFFMYLWCKINMENIKNAGNGSTFEEISKSNFKALDFLAPPQNILNEFDKIISPVFLKIEGNQKQIRRLEQLRSQLLPKLMSGDVQTRFSEV